jgi:hypothetical protein
MRDYEGTPGEWLYDYTPKITRVVGYGASANSIQVCAPGTVDLAKGENRVKAYAV